MRTALYTDSLVYMPPLVLARRTRVSPSASSRRHGLRRPLWPSRRRGGSCLGTARWEIPLPTRWWTRPRLLRRTSPSRGRTRLACPRSAGTAARQKWSPRGAAKGAQVSMPWPRTPWCHSKYSHRKLASGSCRASLTDLLTHLLINLQHGRRHLARGDAEGALQLAIHRGRGHGRGGRAVGGCG